MAALALVLTTMAGTTPSGAQAPPEGPAAPPTAPGGRPGKPASMTPRLAAVANPAVATSSAAAQARAAGLPAEGPASLLRTPEGRLVVDVTLADGNPAALASLRSVGAEVVATDDGPVLATVTVDASRLQALADHPAVAYVAEVPTPQTSAAEGGTPADVGAATDATCPTGLLSEGDGQLRADVARSTFGVDGTGVHVGVLSDSFDYLGGAAADVAAAELPGAANPCGRLTPVGVQAELPGGSGGIDEGRAMAQIVHDLAPGATQTFATAFLGELDFANQITALGVAGADVITDDIYYFLEPMFQDGPIAAAINENRTARDIPHFTSAGNSNAVVGGRPVASYEAPAFRPVACPAGIPAYNNACHDFDPGAGTDSGSGFTLATNGRLSIGFGWSEPMYGVTTDLDLYLVDSTTNTVVAASEIDNGASQRPGEYLAFTNTGSARAFNLVVGRYSASPNPTGTPRLKHVLFRSSGLSAVEWNQSGGGDVVGPTLSGHSAAALAMGTAAVPYFNAATPETFSSRGPASICWAPVSGTAPQAALSPCAVVQPDLAATDGTRNSFFGSFDGTNYRFYGTSAAAPHAAAVAALARQHAPCASADDVESAMTSTAAPVGAFGVESVGAGLVDANAALAALDPCPASISGTVTAAGTGAPLAGVTVGAYADGDGWFPSAAATTAADGSYTIDDLAEGDHRVVFVPSVASGLAQEWWDDTSATSATPISVVDGDVVTGIDAELALGVTFSGTVVTDVGGTPVPNVIVALYQPTDGWFPTAYTHTDAAGNYSLNRLRSATYTVAFVAPDGSFLATEWHTDVRTRSSATLLTLQPGDAATVDASLASANRIAGTVTGPGGTPVAGIAVDVFRVGAFLPLATTTTAANGTYAIDGLASGNHLVRFRTPVGSPLASEWHLNATGPATATVVPLTTGATTIDAQLALKP